MLSLGIDGGSSSAKWSLVDESGAIKSSGNSTPIDGHLYRVESQVKLDQFLQKLILDLGDLRPSVITLGITGLGSPDVIREKFLKTFPHSKLFIGTDVGLAYRSAFEPGEGIYLYAGTGSITVHINPDGQELSLGGWGYLLGDEGAGYWIGQQALRSLIAQLEDLESLDLLSKNLLQDIGVRDWPGIREFVYSNDRSKIANLAPIVSISASQGSENAKAILNGATDCLVELVRRMERRLNSKNMPVSFGGGIAQASLGIGSKIEENLGREITIDSYDHSFTAAKLGLLT